MKIATIPLSMLLLFFSGSVFALKPAPWVGNTIKGEPCTGKPGYGPYDYIKDKSKVALVEQYHFTSEVEALIHGESGSLEGDLNYTLRAFPNHHKALLSVIRLKLDMVKGLRHGKLKTQPECYLMRAISYSPKDPAPYSLYAYYLSNLGQKDKAKELYQQATDIAPDNIRIKYAFALFLLNNNEKNEAYRLAKEIYEKEQNAPTGLRDQLKKAGVWQD